eukprot:2832767-Heterocapsa_arctica.AAC.1
MNRRNGIHSPEPHRQDGVTDESAQRTALRNACTGDKRCTNVRTVLESSRGVAPEGAEGPNDARCHAHV